MDKDQLYLVVAQTLFVLPVSNDQTGRFQGGFWSSPATVLNVAVGHLGYGDGKL